MLSLLWNIDDELNLAVLEQVEDVRTARADSVDATNGVDAALEQEVIGPGRSAELEAQVEELASEEDEVWFVAVTNGEEHRARPRQRLSAAGLGLRKGPAEVSAVTHDLTGRSHLRAEDDVNAREAAPGKDRLLDGDDARLPLIKRVELRQRSTDGDTGGELSEGAIDGLTHKGNRTRGSWVDLDEEDLILLDRELNVHESAHVEREGQLASLFAEPIQDQV